MRTWAFMLGGLIVWSVHFFGVYALASLGAVVEAADAPVWRLAVGGFSALCLAGALALAGVGARRLRRLRGAEAARFAPEVATLGSCLAALAILWQALPAWIGH